MPRKLLRLAVLVAVIGGSLAAASLTAGAATPRASAASVEARTAACPGSIRMGGRRFAFYRHRVTCDGARTAVRRLYASYGRRGTPRGFKCRSRSRFRKTGGCVNRTGSRYFGFNR